MMTPEEAVEATVAELDRRLRERGQGSYQELADRLGISRGYFADLRRGRTGVDLLRLYQTLEFLGGSWVGFFAEVLDFDYFASGAEEGRGKESTDE
jgi:transcriptional regulator with XRE-family HTH domain